MKLSQACEIAKIDEAYLSEEGKMAVIRMDEIAAELVEKMGTTVAQEIVDIVGPGWEYEFFVLIEEYVRKRG